MLRATKNEDRRPKSLTTKITVMGEYIHVDSDPRVMTEVGNEEEHDLPSEEVIFHGDSIVHFEPYPFESLFSIARHPIHPNVILTGGESNKAYIFNTVLPSDGDRGSALRQAEYTFSTHTESVVATLFTLPRGEWAVTADLDGRLAVHKAQTLPRTGEIQGWKSCQTTDEGSEVVWLAACPNLRRPNIFAYGTGDGCVWVQGLNRQQDDGSYLSLLRSSYLHAESCTAGAWSVDGLLLATVSTDGSLAIIDPFTDESNPYSTSSLYKLTADDRRFQIEGGFFSIAVSSNGMYVAAGGADGQIRIVGMPKPASTTVMNKNAGKLIASLRGQTDNIETLSFTPESAPLPLLAAGSVDGSIVLFDAARDFPERRIIRDAHAGETVVKVEFVQNSTLPGNASLLTSCGMDGAVRQWDARSNTSTAVGMIREWEGHQSVKGVDDEEGDGSGGVLDFVQDKDGLKVVTAGDE